MSNYVNIIAKPIYRYKIWRMNVDWYSVGLAAVSGGIAGVLGQLIVSKTIGTKSNLGKVAFAFLVVVIFGIFDYLSKKIILPEIHSWRIEQKLPALFEGNSGIQVIKEFYPATYSEIAQVYINSRKNGLTNQEIMDKSEMLVNNLLLQQLSKSSDDAIIAFARAQVKLIEELYDPNLCFRFLAPQVEGGINIIKETSKPTLKLAQDSVAEVLRSSTDSSQKIKNEVETIENEEKLQSVHNKLAEKFGDDVLIFNVPLTDEKIDRGMYCSMTKNFLIEMLDLPKRESARILRHVFS